MDNTIKEDVLEILRLLSNKEDVTQRDLSDHLGFSLGKTNYLLKSLVKKDLVKINNFISQGNKIRKVKYLLTKRGFKEKIDLTYHFLKKKESEYNKVKREWENLKDKVNV